MRGGGSSGAVRVRRLVAAHDCGLIVNPDGLTNQVEGNLIQATSRALAAEKPRFVDGGIVGPPPREAGTTRLYLSGPEAAGVARLFDGTNVDGAPSQLANRPSQ